MVLIWLFIVFGFFWPCVTMEVLTADEQFPDSIKRIKTFTKNYDDKSMTINGAQFTVTAVPLPPAVIPLANERLKNTVLFIIVKE